MKSLLIILMIAPAVAFLQPNLPAITQAIQQGNATALGKYFDDTVEIAVLDNEDIYDKAQAVNVVKNFFSQHPPKSFSRVHQGTSRGKDSQYCIGNLVSAKGTYRVYIYMKGNGPGARIQELRFDRE